VVVETSKANDVKWDRDNAIFADVLLRADELPDEVEDDGNDATATQSDSLPIGPTSSTASSRAAEAGTSTLFPCHRAMLLRSEFFQAMFSSSFREAHIKDHLNIIDIDCSPEVLEIILTFLYTEKADFSLDVAVEVLFAADMLFIEKLKAKAAVVISTLGSGGMSQVNAARTRGKEEDEIDIYSIIRAAWLTRVQRLEEFAALYLAYRLEAHIDSPEFADLIQESASRIQARQETDSIELLDDIRFYLNERFRLRFDDAGIEEMMEDGAVPEGVDADAQDMEKITNGVESLGVSKKTDPSAAVATKATPQEPHVSVPEIRTLDGAVVEDEFDEDAMNYQILMGKLETLLENLNLDA
jgi:hypothetical protein